MLQALARTPKGKKIAAEKAGMTGKDRDFIKVDLQICTNAFYTQGTFGAVHEPPLMCGSPDYPIAAVQERQQALQSGLLS